MNKTKKKLGFISSSSLSSSTESKPSTPTKKYLDEIPPPLILPSSVSSSVTISSATESCLSLPTSSTTCYCPECEEELESYYRQLEKLHLSSSDSTPMKDGNGANNAAPNDYSAANVRRNVSHIYQSVQESPQYENYLAKTKNQKKQKSKTSSQMSQTSQPPRLGQSGPSRSYPPPSNSSDYQYQVTGEDMYYRYMTASESIKYCKCKKCCERRGDNLTTELLPIDTQVPLQNMLDDGNDVSSFDADLLCTIL